ncbi:hypothetical protein DU508_06485 [Pedobacter chinensis]|uniref:Uncharacterized protein n=1 Tax=Pedobacter chinensis TaxID=2282421 RepID=A0A369Q067_9SPHI|nr:hypothetical protein [Pedobacter chinensis]RDC56845.1 hypothetical protein DU508_06485 [Pedobacter chinensis]
MNSFQLKYHKSNVLIAALIGVPSIGALLMLMILFCLPINAPLWAITLLIFSFLLVMILALRWIIKNQVFVPCTVTINRQGLRFNIEKASLFYDKKNFFSAWENIASISEKFDDQNGGYYYQIRFRKSFIKVNLSAQINCEEEAELFFKELSCFQDILDLSKIEFPDNYNPVYI